MYITFDEIMSYKMKVEGLQAENKRLNDKDGLYDEVKELQAVNDTYQGEIFKLEADIKELRNSKIEFMTKAQTEIKELKAENKRIRNTLRENASMFDKLQAELDKVRKGNIDTIMDVGLDNEKLQAENIELKVALENYQCGCVIPMEYKQEARDYMNHNPKVNKVYFFMVADDCIGDDGYAQDWACSVDDAVAVVHNE
jgi:predicted RNase H-like nuclease (RuvC/YqgF family)